MPGKLGKLPPAAALFAGAVDAPAQQQQLAVIAERQAFFSLIHIHPLYIRPIFQGYCIGTVLVFYFDKVKVRDSVKVLVVLGTSFALAFIEDKWGDVIPFASLIAVMTLGLMMKRKKQDLAACLASQFDKLWIPAEVFLFVLVGASVAIESLKTTGLSAVLLLLGVLIFRMLGVLVCLLGTPLNQKERAFCMAAYTPKATVQAAIGGLPLAMGLACGETVLTVSVVAIILTAPLGALAIEFLHKRCLERSETQ